MSYEDWKNFLKESNIPFTVLTHRITGENTIIIKYKEPNYEYKIFLKDFNDNNVTIRSDYSIISDSEKAKKNINCNEAIK